MSARAFHEKPFDEGTLTKLQIFELYTREWLPVFLARAEPFYPAIHLFDFFAGPGRDSAGVSGSPLRTLKVLREYSSQDLAGWANVEIVPHFFDADPGAVARLEENIVETGSTVSGIDADLQRIDFETALRRYSPILQHPKVAKLLLIDQFGVGAVTDEIFRSLVAFPVTDFLFFISSSTLHRFHEHPAIKQKIVRPRDYYHVHRAALDYYRGLIPNDRKYFLAPFSIRKEANLYGLIFGTAHPRGMDKFLNVAWQSDRLNGEANFDINRDNLRPEELVLELDLMRPTKVTAFEQDLEDSIRSGKAADERDVIYICFRHGVTRRHAKPVLQKLKDAGVIEPSFQVPDIKHLKDPRFLKKG